MPIVRPQSKRSTTVRYPYFVSSFGKRMTVSITPPDPTNFTPAKARGVVHQRREGLETSNATASTPSDIRRTAANHVAGLYEDGHRDGAWGQCYPNGKEEITLAYLDGVELTVTFYSERGDFVSKRVYWEKIRRKLNRQAWRSYGVADGRGYPGYYHSSYYPGSHSWTPPGGGTASDFRNHGGGSAHSGGAGSTGGGGAYVGAPEGSSSGSPSKP